MIKSPWLYKKVQSVLTFLPESYKFTQWESLSSVYIDTMGDSFTIYKGGYQNFLIAELVTAGTLGIINGFTVPNAPTSCYSPLVATTVTQGIYTTSLIALRPFAHPLDNFYFGSIATLQSASLIIATAQHNNPSLQNNTAVQTFVEYTSIAIQALTTTRSIIEIGLLIYAVCQKLKPIISKLNTLNIVDIGDNDASPNDMHLLALPEFTSSGETTNGDMANLL